MLEGQHEQPEMHQKRLRLWLKIGVEVANVAAHLGLAFLLIQIARSNLQALANWTSWVLITGLEILILIVFGAARSAVARIGNPPQEHPSRSDRLETLRDDATTRFRDALSSGRETYRKVKEELSARYNRAKYGEF